MKPQQIAIVGRGYTLPQNFFSGFVKISQVSVIGRGWRSGLPVLRFSRNWELCLLVKLCCKRC